MPRRTLELEHDVAVPIEPSHFRPSRMAAIAGSVDRAAIGVLDPQQEPAAVLAGVEPVEQRGACTADVEEPRGDGANRVTTESVIIGAGHMHERRWCIAGPVHN